MALPKLTKNTPGGLNRTPLFPCAAPAVAGNVCPHRGCGAASGKWWLAVQIRRIGRSGGTLLRLSDSRQSRGVDAPSPQDAVTLAHLADWPAALPGHRAGETRAAAGQMVSPCPTLGAGGAVTVRLSGKPCRFSVAGAPVAILPRRPIAERQKMP